jgi:hypothetical protein
VVVLCLRYVLEGMSEEEVIAVDRAGNVANCSVTEYRFDPAAGKDGGMVLVRFNVVDAIAAEDGPVTAEPRRSISE